LTLRYVTLLTCLLKFWGKTQAASV